MHGKCTTGKTNKRTYLLKTNSTEAINVVFVKHLTRRGGMEWDGME